MSIDLRNGELLRDAMVDMSKPNGECDTCGRVRNLDAGMCAMCWDSAKPPPDDSVAAEAMAQHIGDEVKSSTCGKCGKVSYNTTGECSHCPTEVTSPDVTEPEPEPVPEPKCEFEGCDREGIECPIDGRLFCPVHLNDHMETIMDAQREAVVEDMDEDIPL